MSKAEHQLKRRTARRSLNKRNSTVRGNQLLGLERKRKMIPCLSMVLKT
ncbi:mCG1044307 [Mus musculus]|nr:mCG1044307 [Mus musculus]